MQPLLFALALLLQAGRPFVLTTPARPAVSARATSGGETNWRGETKWHGGGDDARPRTRRTTAALRMSVAGPMSATEATFKGQDGRDIFCNRELNMGQVEAIGFDMDYTLAQYNTAFELLAFNGAKEKLVNNKCYPEAVLEFTHDPTAFSRGLVIDKELGNFLKVDRHKCVSSAMRSARAARALCCAPSTATTIARCRTPCCALVEAGLWRAVGFAASTSPTELSPSIASSHSRSLALLVGTAASRTTARARCRARSASGSTRATASTDACRSSQATASSTSTRSSRCVNARAAAAARARAWGGNLQRPLTRTR